MVKFIPFATFYLYVRVFCTVLVDKIELLEGCDLSYVHENSLLLLYL